MKRKVKRSLAGMLALLLTLAVAFPVPVQARETVAEAERILPAGAGGRTGDFAGSKCCRTGR